MITKIEISTTGCTGFTASHRDPPRVEATLKMRASMEISVDVYDKHRVDVVSEVKKRVRHRLVYDVYGEMEQAMRTALCELLVRADPRDNMREFENPAVTRLKEALGKIEALKEKDLA